MVKYYPTLKGKSSEMDALATFTGRQAEMLTPIIELLPDTLTKYLEKISIPWSFDNNQIIIDSHLLKRFDRRLEALDFMSSLLDEGVNAIPVISLMDGDIRFNDRAIEFVKRHNTKLAIRFLDTDLNPNIIGRIVSEFLTEHRFSPDRIIVILDAQEITEFSILGYKTLIPKCINALPHLSRWDAVVVAGGSFPTDLTQFEEGEIHVVPQHEWDLWSHLVADPKLAPYIRYGDYATRYPIHNFTPARFTPSCSIKYSTRGNFIVFRGKQPQHHVDAGGQYHTKSREVIGSGYYDGASFSWADNEIYEIGNRDEQPGGFAKWVTIANNRHIVKVLSML